MGDECPNRYELNDEWQNVGVLPGEWMLSGGLRTVGWSSCRFRSGSAQGMKEEMKIGAEVLTGAPPAIEGMPTRDTALAD